MSFTIGSLFDGSGGFPLAASLCGGTPKWASEVEPYPIAVTTSRFPEMKHLGSITDIKGGEIEPVDVVSFGSPCQDLSTAGLKNGIKHVANGDDETTRSGLFLEAVRVIKEMRDVTNGLYPRFALWENVPGAFSSNKGEDFRTVLGELIGIVEPTAVMPPVPKGGWAYADSYCGDGWSLAYRVFDAQHWGVPQRRKRIHLVLDLRGERAREVLFERDGLRGHFAESGTTWKDLTSDAERSTGADGSNRNCVSYAETYQKTTDPLMANSHPGSYCGQDAYQDMFVVGKEAAGERSVLPFDTTQITSPQNGNNPKWGDPSHPLTAGGQPPTVICKEQYLYENHSQDTRYKGPLDVCPSLPAQLGTGGNNTPFVVENSTRYIVRRLTPTECARLQGFPDNWGHPDPKEDFTDEEYVFWLNVRNTHAAINDKAVKEYTKEQMLKWYNKLHTDSAEYKMWGNGIALPPALYCMQGIADVMVEEKAARSKWLDDLLEDCE